MIDGILYRDYFQHQAEAHPDLLHAADNLVFAQVSVEEAIGDLRDANISDGGYIMRLIEPVFRLSAGEQFPQQTFDGGFMIARRYNVREVGSQDYIDAIDGSEKIGTDIIEKMYADSENGHPLFEYMAFGSLNITARIRPVVGDAGYGGWLFLWSIRRHFTYCSPADRAVWTDGGLTPAG